MIDEWMKALKNTMFIFSFFLFDFNFFAKRLKHYCCFPLCKHSGCFFRRIRNLVSFSIFHISSIPSSSLCQRTARKKGKARTKCLPFSWNLIRIHSFIGKRLLWVCCACKFYAKDTSAIELWMCGKFTIQVDALTWQFSIFEFWQFSAIWHIQFVRSLLQFAWHEIMSF